MATLALRFCGKRYPSNFSRSHAADWGPGEGRNASRGLWLDDEFTGLKTLTLRRLFRAHFLVWSLTRPAGLGRGTPLRRRPPCHPSVSAFPYPSRSCGITPACASHAETHATNGCPVRPMKRCTLLFSASCQFTDPQPGSLENLKAQR